MHERTQNIIYQAQNQYGEYQDRYIYAKHKQVSKNPISDFI